jgi:hypothetical protein
MDRSPFLKNSSFEVRKSRSCLEGPEEELQAGY